MQEKLAALKKKFDSLPPAAKVAAAAGVGLLLFMLMKLLKGSSTKTTAANQYTESDGTIIYPYAVDYTEAAGSDTGGSSGGGSVADGYYATSADLAAVVDAMTAGNTMLLDRIDSTMRGSDVTAGNIMPQTYADIKQAGVLDNKPVLSSVVPATSGSKVASDGKIYATGGTGKNYVYNPDTGNITVNGKTVTRGSSTYNATLTAMLNDGVTIPSASTSTGGSSSSKTSSSSSSKTSSSSSSKTSSSSNTSSSSSKTSSTASDGKIYATGGTGKSYVYNPKTGNIMVNGKAVTKGSSTYNTTIAAAKADGVKI